MFFISPQKLFSFSRYFGFCLDLLVMYHNDFMYQKDKVNFTLNESQPG